jgi:flagellar biogenesis protein FliO
MLVAGLLLMLSGIFSIATGVTQSISLGIEEMPSIVPPGALQLIIGLIFIASWDYKRIEEKQGNKPVSLPR